jgi:hypothetical protein
MGDDSGMMLTMLIADDEAAIQNSLRQFQLERTGNRID